jgi:hypothetical protein
VTFLLTLVYVAPASATTLVTPDGQTRPQPYQSWVDRSDVPTPPGKVTLALAPCPGGPAWAAGCADTANRVIYLGTNARDRARLLHELGHIFDRHVMSNPLRARFTAVAGLTGPWHSTQADPPEEQFAEAYSVCGRFSSLRQMYFGMYAYSPTPARHRRACSVIRQAAGLPATAAKKRR